MLLFEAREGKKCLALSEDCSRSIYTALWRLVVSNLLCQNSHFLPAHSYRMPSHDTGSTSTLQGTMVDPCCLIQVSSPSRDKRDCTHLEGMHSWKHCQEFSKLFFALSFLKTQLQAVQQIFPSSVVSHPKASALILSVLSLKVLARY